MEPNQNSWVGYYLMSAGVEFVRRFDAGGEVLDRSLHLFRNHLPDRDVELERSDRREHGAVADRLV